MMNGDSGEKRSFFYEEREFFLCDKITQEKEYNHREREADEPHAREASFSPYLREKNKEKLLLFPMSDSHLSGRYIISLS